MRTDFDHLPAAKQRELERVVQILFEEFEEARVLSTQDWKKKGRILKIVLYGSYARGGWVDELPYDEIARRNAITIREVERQMARAIYKIVKQMDGEPLNWWERWF